MAKLTDESRRRVVALYSKCHNVYEIQQRLNQGVGFYALQGLIRNYWLHTIHFCEIEQSVLLTTIMVNDTTVDCMCI